MDGHIFFEIIDKRMRSHAPVLVPTHDRNENIVLRSPLSLCVQFYSLWKSHPDLFKTVLADSDQE